MNAISTAYSGMMQAQALFDRSAHQMVNAAQAGGAGDIAAAVTTQIQAEAAHAASAAVARTAADLEQHVIDILV